MTLPGKRMKYLGYDFYAYKKQTKNPQQKGKLMVTNELPKSKEDVIVKKCRELLHDIRRNPSFETIHAWNAYVVGVHNYYKGMSLFCLSFRKIGWRIKELFYHTMSRDVKFIKDQAYKDNFQGGEYRSWGKRGYYCFHQFPVIEIQWASWDNKLIAAGKGKVIRKNPYAYGEKKHNPGVSMKDISYLVNTSKYIKNSRLAMFRISKYSSMKGVSYLSGNFVPVDEYHCHHIKPLSKGGTNDFKNLCVLSKMEHTILHSSTPERLYSIFPRKIRRIKALIDSLQRD